MEYCQFDIMSNSVFEELPLEDVNKVDSNLVIVVNKDGSVSVDQTILHDFLGNYISVYIYWCWIKKTKSLININWI